MTNKDKIEVKIPRQLYQKVEKRVSLSRKVKSPNKVVKYILEEFLGEKKGATYSKKEEEEIKKRLSDLGY